MLIGVKDYYENYHKVRITDTLVGKAVVLSERYINDRFLPDKAIDLLDEACTCANLRNKHISEFEIAQEKLASLKKEQESLSDDTGEQDFERIAELKTEIMKLEDGMKELEELASDNQVREDDLATVIQLWTGIPASKVIESDLKRLAELENNLKAKLIGQDEAVRLVAAAIRRGRVQISPRRRRSSFIFVGPTGVGKTELAKSLAECLFDDEHNIVRIDMTEYMEKFSVSRLIGAPPGYVGYDEGGQLTEAVRRKPYSVVLFDEIEKAHPDVFNILLQILDDGRITDSQGRTVDFKNTIVILTSNLGSQYLLSGIRADGTIADDAREAVMAELRRSFRPEFLNRLDETILFRPLTKENLTGIIDIMTKSLADRLADRSLKLVITDAAKNPIIERGYDPLYGARPLRRYLQSSVETLLARVILSGDLAAGTTLTVDTEDGELVCR
jgi:ATP-dependent Clp protease ATP-binding subunit ClpB